MRDEKNTSASPASLKDDARNQTLAEHLKKYPEGDPSVRRISPDKGRIWSKNINDKKI
jgi:hypothetical protein